MILPEEILKRAGATKARSDKSLVDLYAFSKSLEPTLRDLGQHHLADRLAALVGEADAAKAETMALADEAMKFLLGRLA